MNNNALNQDYESLVKIGLSALCYDLSNKAFREYAHNRGVLYKAGCGKRFDYYTIHCIDYGVFCRLFSHAIEYPPNSGNRHAYTQAELKQHYEISLATRGALEDCYRLYIKGL